MLKTHREPEYGESVEFLRPDLFDFQRERNENIVNEQNYNKELAQFCRRVSLTLTIGCQCIVL